MVRSWTLTVAFSALGALAAIAVLPAAGPSATLRAVGPSDLRTADRRMAASRPRAVATDCAPKGTNSFLGAGNTNNAGGTEAAVVAGQYNQACNQLAFIGAGASNVIYNSSAATAAEESFIGGGESNFISNYRSGIVAGMNGDVGGSFAFIGSGFMNTAYASYSFVGSGEDNIAHGQGSVVVGGDSQYNTVQNENGRSQINDGNAAIGTDSFVGAGDQNQAGGNGAFVGGGGFLYSESGLVAAGNQAAGIDSFVGAGDQNVATANQAFIGAGTINAITAPATYGTIGGGGRNTVAGEYGSIAGGYGNRVSGSYGVVAGGDGNVAGELSFAAGYGAEATHNGSFVWSDFVSGSSKLTDSANDQFRVRASGGITMYSDETLATGVTLSAGSGTWASVSDRNAKTDIAALDDGSVLAKVDALPVNVWRYKTERGVRHLGPMAQDFYAAFGVGADDRHITSIDEDGVALAAIKALHRENGALHHANAALTSRVSLLESQVRALIVMEKRRN